MNNMPAEKNRRILIIDDNRAIHNDFRKILAPNTTAGVALDTAEAELFGSPTNAVRKTQYEIDSAYQGREGVMLAAKALEAGRPYAMAFVDVRMPPGWDGVETTGKLWEMDPNLQIVICTAYSDYSWGEMFEELGQRDGLLILKKPFDAVEAFQLAHALTEKWWLHQQSRRKMEELENRVAERTHELQQKTALLEAQLNSSIDGILIVDQEGKTALQNQRLIDIFKVPQHLANEEADEDRLRWVAGMTKNPKQFVEKVLHLYAHPDEISRDEIEFKDGTFLDRYSAPVVGKDGKNYGRILTFRDITERKRADELLHSSEERFRIAAETANDVVYEWDLKEGLEWPGKIDELLGYEPGEFPRTMKGWADSVHPEDLERTTAAIQAHLEGRGPYAIEYRVRRKDGAYRWWAARGAVARTPDGTPTRWIGSITDITERKQAEEELKFKNIVLSAQQQASIDAILVVDQDANILSFNHRFVEMWGIPSELIEKKADKPVLQWVTNQMADPPSFLQRVQYLYEHRREISQEEILLKDGRIFDRYSAPMFGTDDQYFGRIWYFRDITERKRAEELLRASQQLIKGIINAIPVRVFWKDKNLVYLGCNVIFARDAGFADPKDIIGKDDYQMAWRDRAEQYRGDDRQVIESGCAKSLIEEPLTTPEGNIVTILTSKVPLRSSTGEISGVIGTFMDITERKRADDLLRLSEERFRVAAETTNDVIYEWDLKQSVEWLGKIDELLGYEPGGFPRTMDGFAASVHPEDLERTMAAIQAHLVGRGPFAIEYRVRRKDGIYRWWSARGAVTRTPDGKPTRWIGSITDITERKQVEERIEWLSRFPSENPYPVLRVSAQGVLEYANAAADTVLTAIGAEVGGTVNAEWQARIGETLANAAPGQH